MTPADITSELQYFLSQLNAVVVNIRLYASNHPQAERHMENVFNNLMGLLRIRREVTVMLIGDDMVVNNTPFQADKLNLGGFCRLLRDRGIGRLTFLKGVTETQFQLFVRDLAATGAGAIKGSEHVKIGKVELKVKPAAIPGAAGASKEEREKVDSIQEIRDSRYDEIKTIYHTARRHRKIDIRGVDDMIRAFIQGVSDGINPLGLMASLKSTDEYTFTHVVNVCILTMGQAEALGIGGNRLYQIGVASMLHDVGKLFIPDEIINKPGRLTDEERGIVETHTTQGARYLLQVDNIPKLAVLGAIEHHIKYDGTGYPSFSGGWEPNIVSQMIAISDVFDALRSRRVYSEPKPTELIYGILNKEKGTTFNPFLVNNFMTMVGGKATRASGAKSL
jgi:HD-GYP domain-containing protein (c-di-GMP phosphodiesterase class II)